ncbi:unnamed protein product, partial [Closterium sp. NIES-53]
VDRCLAYLANTRESTLEFGGGPESLKLVGYIDADDAGEKRNRTSTGDYVFVFGGGAISWSIQCIKCATLSLIESATEAGKEGRRLRFHLVEFRLLDANRPSGGQQHMVKRGKFTLNYIRVYKFLDYAASPVAESESLCPPSVGGECALGMDVLEDRHENFECLAAAVPHLVAMLLAPEGDPDALDIPTPRSYAEAITGTYVDVLPLPGANIVDGMWIFRVKRPPGQPVRGDMTVPPTWLHWVVSCRTTRAALGFAPSTADPLRFLRTKTSLPPFYILVYVIQRFSFRYSSPQSTPLPTGHSLSVPPSDESVEMNGPYPELVGCLISSCEAEIYAGAMAAQELCWLTYLLTDLGERRRSSPVLYVDNKAMIALCQEHRLEHRMKHIALRDFLARELRQRGQLHLAYVATRANTPDIFIKVLLSGVRVRPGTTPLLMSPPVAPPTLLWHHRLGHPFLPRLRGMHSRLLVSGLPRSLPPLSPSPAPPCLPCVEGRQRAAPHSSSFPPTIAPLQTLHMDVWGPARVNGQGSEHYFLLVVDNYMRYTTVFSLRSKGERRIGLVMEVARTSMIHAVAPLSLWSFAVLYAAHQLNLWPRVSLAGTSPTERWMGKVGDASDFRFYHPTSRRILPSKDVTFDKSAPFHHLVPYRSAPLPPPPLFLAPGHPPVDPLPPQGPTPSSVSQVDPLLGIVSVEVAVDSGAARGAASKGAEPVGAEPGGAESEGARSGGAQPRGAEPKGAEPEGAESGGAESENAEPTGAEPRGTASSGGPAGASPRLSPRPEPISP